MDTFHINATFPLVHDFPLHLSLNTALIKVIFLGFTAFLVIKKFIFSNLVLSKKNLITLKSINSKKKQTKFNIMNN